MQDRMDGEQLDDLSTRIDGWLDVLRRDNEQISAVDRVDEDAVRRWFVRLRGDEKDVTTIWFALRERTLRYETYVMPAPEENDAVLYEQLLRRNERLVGVHFSIGDEDAVFLRGEMPASSVDEVALDRIVGTVFGVVEQTFQGLLRIGFASRFG
ncbi:MAG: YbjN domain-containing protein [Ilumatobacteraceae bacterium]